MKYTEALDYLFGQLPMFQRQGKKAFKKDLTNIIALCDALGNPQDKFKSIHIAGTNGKGSSTHMIGSILQAAGFKTAYYTSPHYKDFRERIKINGQLIPKRSVSHFVQKYKAVFEEIKPSFFEISVAMAFDYFAKSDIDIAVIETGLGGRLDSTNVLHPLLCLITNISYDHQAFLGDTLVKIAGEKAGIIKQKTPVVISETQESCKEVFIQKALEMEADISFADETYQVNCINEQIQFLEFDVFENKELFLENLKLDISGTFQAKNLIGTLKTIEKLNTLGFHIVKRAIRIGLGNLRTLSYFMGRWQVLNKAPLAIADSGHNEGGLKISMMQINRLSSKRLHFVLGMVKDKDSAKVLELLPKEAIYYFCKPDIPRGKAADLLLKEAKEYDLNGTIFPSVKKAYKAALKAADAEDLIFCGGSTFVVAELV